MSAQTGRLILPHVHLMVEIEGNGGRGARVTGALLPFLLEQMVAAGALEIFITDAWKYEGLLGELPDSARRYVRVSDISIRARRVADEFFASIFEELGIHYEGGGYRFRYAGDLNPELRGVLHAHMDLITFLQAFFLKAHVHFDVNLFASRLQTTALIVRSIENRIKISSILSCISVYNKVELATANIIPSCSRERANKLEEIILTEEYNALSRAHFSLGLMTNAQHALDQIRLRLNRLVALGVSKELINFGSKAASVATASPIPDSKLVESFVQDSFLPPAIDLSDQIRGALADLQKFEPDTYSKLFHSSS